MTEIYKKLAEIQKTLNVPKSQYNSFSKFYYRSCEDILEAVKPLLDGYTLIISDDVVNVGNRNYVKATVTLTDGKESISNTALAREEETKKGMDGAQITGSSSSYARKYALNGLFAIDDTKDADTQDNRKTADSTDTSRLASMYQVTSTLELMEKLQKINNDESRTEAIATVIEGLRLCKEGKRPMETEDVTKIHAGAVKRIADIQGEVI